MMACSKRYTGIYSYRILDWSGKSSQKCDFAILFPLRGLDGPAESHFQTIYYSHLQMSGPLGYIVRE